MEAHEPFEAAGTSTVRLWIALPSSGVVDVVAADRLGRIFAAIVEELRQQDPVELLIATRGLPETDAFQVVLDVAQTFGHDLQETCAISVTSGEVPASVHLSDVLADLDVPVGDQAAARRIHRARADAARITTLTPVADSAEWAPDFRPVRGFRHVVIDAGSTDGAAQELLDRGVDLVLPVATSGLGDTTWSAAHRLLASSAPGQWVKPLLPGDHLAQGCASLLEQVVERFPGVGLVVMEHLAEHDGRLERWSSLPETTLVPPSEALRMSALHGNWFGPSIGHFFSPAAAQLVEPGGAPGTREWQACLSVASKMPTLYLKEVAGTRRTGAAEPTSTPFHLQLQEAEIRLRSALDVRPADPGLAEAAQEFVHRWLVAEAPPGPARAAETTHQVSPLAGFGPRIALHHPQLDVSDQYFHGYVSHFAERSATLAYFPVLADHPELAPQLGVSDGCLRRGTRVWEVVTSARELQQKADVLVSFQGRPDAPHLAPPRAFTGLKAYHVMDFAHRASDAGRSLREGGADILLGYARHDVHSDFFQHFYAGFAGRVLPVPFGFASRFAVRKPFAQRSRQVIGMGALYPVDDPRVGNGDIDDLKAFYAHVAWVHPWRRILQEESARLGDVLDSRYPRPPQALDTTPKSEEVLNQYQAFANDESLMAFPPIRTYEGVASGAVLVGNAHPCYEELGFEHGVSALFHRPRDIDDFERVVRAGLNDQSWLESIAATGTALVRSRYNHSSIADSLQASLLEFFSRRMGASAPVRGGDEAAAGIAAVA